MAERVLPVTAYTTLDLADFEAEGHGWRDESFAVVNVTTDDGRVVLELEPDDGDTRLAPHADRLKLDPGEASELADALADAAGTSSGEPSAADAPEDAADRA